MMMMMMKPKSFCRDLEERDPTQQRGKMVEIF